MSNLKKFFGGNRHISQINYQLIKIKKMLVVKFSTETLISKNSSNDT